MNRESDICRFHLSFLPSILQSQNEIAITDLCKKDSYYEEKKKYQI